MGGFTQFSDLEVLVGILICGMNVHDFHCKHCGFEWTGIFPADVRVVYCMGCDGEINLEEK